METELGESTNIGVDVDGKPNSVKSFLSTNKWILLISAFFMLIFLVPYFIVNHL